MSEAVNHPFPYFKIPVTRDGDVIRRAVEDMYAIRKKFESHPTRNQEYRDFTNYALLIAKQAGTKPGAYEANQPLVEAIVKKCLDELRDYFMGQVSAYDKSVHPQQIDKCIETAKKPPLYIDEKESRRFIDDLIKSEGIKITVVQPPAAPKRTPQPVTQVRAECGDREVRLFWNPPATDCDGVKIARSERGNPKLSDEVGDSKTKQWNDTTIIPGKRYTYCVFSILGTEALGSDQVSIAARGVVADLKVTVAGTKAALSWKLPENAEEVLVFRSASPIAGLVNDQGRLTLPPKVEQIATLGGATTFEDAKVSPGSTWHYAVAARHEVGSCSPSESRAITLPLAPNSVAGLKTEVVGAGHVYLSWQPVTGFGACLYRILREEVGSAKDPEILDTVKRTVYDDAGVRPGTTYRYSVLTLAGGIEGLAPVIGPPVTATGEVADLSAAAKESLVTLSWTPPAGVKRVEIRRQMNTPPLPAEGPGSASPGVDLFTAFETGRYVDTRVVNGNTYGYRISCVFLTADGKEIVTRGETATAAPRRAPPAVLSPRIETVGTGVRIGWDNPNGVNVVVIRGAERPDFRPSEQRPLAKLDSLGERLASCGKTEVIDPGPDPGRHPYYLIFSIDPHVGVFCGAVRILEVTGANVEQEEGNVIVRWPWPESCSGVRITRSGEGKPLDVPRSATKGDSAKALFPIDKLGPGEHAFHLQCLTVASDPSLIQGPGVTVRTKVVKLERISWRLERKKEGGWRRRDESVEVVIVGERGFAQVDRLVLAGRVARCPDNVEEGTFRKEFQPIADLDGVVRFKAPDWKSSYGRVFCRLFVVPADAGRITHPPAEECAL